MKINIGIDGPVASGKSTIAKLVANKLGYTHIDSGAMYRCIALCALRSSLNLQDEAAINKLLASTNIQLNLDGSIICNGEDVTDSIRSHEVSNAASTIAAFSSVRKNLVLQQQRLAKEKGFVMDGRDINTVVLPDAECQIYLTASIESRALRRSREYFQRGHSMDLNIIKRDIEKRDHNDMNRLDSPLKISQRAYVIDTSHMEIDEVVNAILTHAREVMKHD